MTTPSATRSPARAPAKSSAGAPTSASASAPASAAVPAATAAPAPARRRFRASDVATHLDMLVIGEVCVGVSLAGYRSVLVGFLADGSGNQAALLAALERADTAALAALAHAVKGASASLGLRSAQALASRIEAEGAAWDAAACSAAAGTLRETLETTQALLQRMGFT